MHVSRVAQKIALKTPGAVKLGVFFFEPFSNQDADYINSVETQYILVLAETTLRKA